MRYIDLLCNLHIQLTKKENAMKNIFKWITFTVVIIGTMLATSTSHAVVKQTKDDCTIWIGTPYKVRNTVYASSNIVCNNSKLHITNTHSLTQNSRFWAWKTKASSYSKKTNATRNYLRTRYVCNGATATHKWRGHARFEVKKNDNWFNSTFLKGVTGHHKTLTCN